MIIGLLALAATAAVPMTPAEQELLSVYDDNKLITARRIADELMATQPDSLVGNYVLGSVFRESEGNLPKAMYHLGRARELYEVQYMNTAQEDAHLHGNILLGIIVTAAEMELHEYELQMLDYYDSVYDPNLTAEHAWPLMKLGRFDDAREYASKATGSHDPWQKSLGHNALCALEGEALARKASFQACTAALEYERRAENPDVNVAAYNASLTARSVLRFDEAEALALEANTGAGISTANPWVLLVDLRLNQGRGEPAVRALEDLQRWRAAQPPHLRAQSRAEADAAFARLLLVAGQGDTGMDIITRALEFPDRKGYTSSDSDQALGGHSLTRLAMRRVQRERVAEQVATWGFLPRTGNWVTSLGPDWADWEDRAAVTAAMSNRRRLDATLRMYVNGGIDAPPWLLGDLIDVLGPGVVTTALADIRPQETEFPVLHAYYDALEAEARLHRGDRDGAVELANRALDTLPETEVLIRARVAAVGAEAAWRSWDEATALDLYEYAMQRDPGVFRRLGFAIPATVKQNNETWAATYATRMIRRSPRLRSSSSGFEVSIEGAADHLQVCVRSPRGTLLSCANAPKPPPDTEGLQEGELPVELTDWEYAQYVAFVFHERAFAMPLGVSGTDLKSLDGSNVIDSEAARQHMEGLLQHAIEGQ